MIVFGEQSVDGSILHLLIGPETEMSMDLKGSSKLDVTPLLESLSGSEKVVLSINRCRSEMDTDLQMSEFDISHLCSFDNGGEVVEIEEDEVEEVSCLGSVSDVRVGVCDYCSQTKGLLDLPGFNICSQCVMIELGIDRKKPCDKSVDSLVKSVVGIYREVKNG